MNVNMFVNEVELRKAIEQLYPNGDLFEVRIIQKGNAKGALSGYFKDADTLLECFKRVDLRDANVYITLNQINESLFSRMQSETFIKGANTTQDNDVDGYKWLFIDLDPIRTTGVSSSKDELDKAYELAGRIYQYLKDRGFEEPVKAVSGNGAHLLYRIKLQNNDANKQLVERCLKALSMLFDNEYVSVDTANFNPSRICKLYGTLAQKGKSTEERPHRMSRIIGDVKECIPTDIKYLEMLAAELPQEQPKATKYNNYNPSEFNVEDWLDKYGLSYRKAPFKDGTKYLLDECPFNPDHKAPDSMVTVGSMGAIGFKCLHNSCQDKHWRDLRLMYEPDAYEYSDADRRIDEGYLAHNRDKDLKIKPKSEITQPMFLNGRMILDDPEPEAEFIKSGIQVIDKKLKGLQKGKVSLLSGLRGAAKSTFIGQVVLNCIQHEQTSVIYSGELGKKNFLNWLCMQAAGKGYTKPYTEYEGYYCPNEIKPAIADWMGDYMWLYNNQYGNNFNEINTFLRSEIEKRKADICVVDNLMALDLSSYDSDKYDAQTKFVWELNDIAKRLNVHIIFVAHPRKAQGFLRLDDVSGSANISNIVDNAFIIHRNNADFQRLTKQMFGWKESNEAYSGTNVVEICKEREGGNQDIFIPLWYEPQTKRLKNYEQENIVYSWKKPGENEGFVNVETPDEIPWES